MKPEPDLTAELDAAEDIVMGRVESVVTEWGVRYDGIDPRVIPYGISRVSERMARMDAATDRETVVRRTVTYDPWEEAPEVDPVTLAAEALSAHKERCRATPPEMLGNPFCDECVTLTAAWRQALREAGQITTTPPAG